MTGNALDGSTDKVMATLMDADSRGSIRREREGATSKGTGLLVPMFYNGVQSNVQP